MLRSSSRLQAKHATEVHAQHCNTNILLQQAAGAITHLQAQLADAQAALVTAQAAALPAACSPAARSPAT